MSAWTRTTLGGDAGRKASEIRIYCNEDSDWALSRDDPKLPENERNSKKEASRQTWVDNVNNIMTIGPPKCGGPPTNDGDTAAVLYRIGFDDSDPANHPLRARMTVCVPNHPQRVQLTFS